MSQGRLPPAPVARPEKGVPSYSAAGVLPVTTVAQMELEIERQIVTLPVDQQFLARAEQLRRRITYARAIKATSEGGGLTAQEREIIEVVATVRISAKPPVVTLKPYLGDDSRRQYTMSCTVGTEEFKSSCTEDDRPSAQADFERDVERHVFFTELEKIRRLMEEIDTILSRHGKWGLDTQIAMHTGGYTSRTKTEEDEEAAYAESLRLAAESAPVAASPRREDEAPLGGDEDEETLALDDSDDEDG